MVSKLRLVTATEAAAEPICIDGPQETVARRTLSFRIDASLLITREPRFSHTAGEVGRPLRYSVVGGVCSYSTTYMLYPSALCSFYTTFVTKHNISPNRQRFPGV